MSVAAWLATLEAFAIAVTFISAVKSMDRTNELGGNQGHVVAVVGLVMIFAVLITAAQVLAWVTT